MKKATQIHTLVKEIDDLLNQDYTSLLGPEAKPTEPTQMMKETFRIELELLQMQFEGDRAAMKKQVSDSKRKCRGVQTRSRARERELEKSSEVLSSLIKKWKKPDRKEVAINQFLEKEKEAVEKTVISLLTEAETEFGQAGSAASENTVQVRNPEISGRRKRGNAIESPSQRGEELTLDQTSKRLQYEAEEVPNMH